MKEIQDLNIENALRTAFAVTPINTEQKLADGTNIVVQQILLTGCFSDFPLSFPVQSVAERFAVFKSSGGNTGSHRSSLPNSQVSLYLFLWIFANVYFPISDQMFNKILRILFRSF